MGEVQVPADAYYSAQTQRAVENFPISGWHLPDALIRAMGLVKLACATVNNDLGKLTGTGKNPLDAKQVQAMCAACQEIIDGKMDDQFPVDVFQTGSGTSSNMNINEVISNRAIEILGGNRLDKVKPIQDWANPLDGCNSVAIGTGIRRVCKADSSFDRKGQSRCQGSV